MWAVVAAAVTALGLVFVALVNNFVSIVSYFSPSEIKSDESVGCKGFTCNFRTVVLYCDKLDDTAIALIVNEYSLGPNEVTIRHLSNPEVKSMPAKEIDLTHHFAYGDNVLSLRSSNRAGPGTVNCDLILDTGEKFPVLEGRRESPGTIQNNLLLMRRLPENPK
jgi:hypothetical protein